MLTLSSPEYLCRVDFFKFLDYLTFDPRYHLTTLGVSEDDWCHQNILFLLSYEQETVN